MFEGRTRAWLVLSAIVLAGACSEGSGDEDRGEEAGNDDQGEGGKGTGGKSRSGGGGGNSDTGQNRAGNNQGGKGGTTGGQGGVTEGQGGKGEAGKGQAGQDGKAGAGGKDGGAAGSPGAGGAGGETVVSENTPGDGYFANDYWHGWIWAAGVGTDTTINKTDFGADPPTGPWCVKGSIGKSYDYSALLGINLKQDKSPEDAPQNEWTPTSTGLTVKVTNTAKTKLRVQIQSADGADNADHRWCADLTSTTNFVKWETFNTKCWDTKLTGAKAYNKEPIAQVIIQVPGEESKSVAYEFCLDGVADGDGTGGECSVPVGALSTQWDRKDTTKDCKTWYVLQNNLWGLADGAATQTVLDFNGTSFTLTKTEPGSRSASGSNPDKPFGYPSIFYGTNKDAASKDTVLPKQVSSITSASTTWKTNAGSISGEYNAAYDIWFNTSSSPSNPPTGGYLMVWFYHSGSVSPVGGCSGNFTSGGKSFKVCKGTYNNVPVTSYVSDSAITDFTFDIKEFFKNSGYSESWYLTAVMAGYEIWSGGQGLKTNEFSVSVK